MNILSNISRDSEGYLNVMSDWTTEIAIAIAEEDSIILTSDHWVVIHLLREFYCKYAISPAIRPLVKSMGEKLGAGKNSSVFLAKLFPKGAAKQANKFSGLPKPIRCI